MAKNTNFEESIKNLELNLNEEQKAAINKSIKDFKATLFIENLKINSQEKPNYIEKVELNLEEIDK